jgi:DNA invertase Pin-like site-specific DNA recombinase
MSPQIHLAYSDSLERQIYNSLKSNRLHETQAENPCICWEKSKYGKARDYASGRRDDRPGLQACLKALQPSTTLVVWKLDRLGRDLKHLISLMDDLRRREVGFKVLAGSGAQIDTTTANGRLVFGIFAALSEYESELIRERTRAGLASARARGRMGGRPRKMTKAVLAMAMAAMADPSSNAREVAKRLGITTSTLYEYVNGDGSLKPAGAALLGAKPSPQGSVLDGLRRRWRR